MVRQYNFKNPKSSHSLAKDSLIMFAGTMTANAGSYIYHLVTGRILGPQGYGELSSIISLFYLLSVPGLVLQMALVKYFALAKTKNDPGYAKDLFIRAFGLFIKFSLIAGIIFLPLSPLVTGYLHLNNPWYGIILYLIFFLTVISVVNTSYLQGYQMFTWLALYTGGLVMAKLFMSVPLAGFGVFPLLVVQIFSMFLIYLISFFPIRKILLLPAKRLEITKAGAIGNLVPVFVTVLGMTSLYSVDIMMVKHYFPAEISGEYAALALMGKIVFFASSAVGSVVYPIISERAIRKSPYRKIVFLATILVLTASAGITVLYGMFPKLIVGTLYGQTYLTAATYLPFFAVFMSLYSVANLYLYICLGLNFMKASWGALVAALFQAVGIGMFHGTITQVITVNIVLCAVLLLYVYSVYRYNTNKSK